MEDIHGVDVSWLHHSNREHHHRHHNSDAPALRRSSPSRKRPENESNAEPAEKRLNGTNYNAQEPRSPLPPATNNSNATKTTPRRPALLNRGSSEKVGNGSQDGRSSSRRNSWISSISSKFSSSPVAPSQLNGARGPPSPAHTNGTSSASLGNGTLDGTTSGQNNNQAGSEGYFAQQPKGSFFSNALRRLSSGSSVGPLGRVASQGHICARRVMNIDPNRPRCLVPELDQNKLRRVAFCVDVEIAGGPKYKDDVDSEEKKRKAKDRKLKERGEGEALRHPELLIQEKEADGVIKVDTAQEVVGTEDSPNPEGTVVEGEKKEISRKKEKKKKSEADRKERKEKKRRKAEENGQIPLELKFDEHDDIDGAVQLGPSPSRPQGRPTTDPLRIYRRCCQLRETPILKRISDQLSAPSTCVATEPGVVTRLDLAGSRLQLADVVTLSDWLAIVPVKKLLLEDADLSDEKLRVILAGLLATKMQEPLRRRRLTQTQSDPNGHVKIEERSGVIEKLCLKNNSKITKVGWKHISLFLYLCRSIKAIDVSMIPFPSCSPPGIAQTAADPSESQPTKGGDGDMAETLSKALSERLGGSQLEELVMGECSLTSRSIRRIIDGVIMSGIQRLGLAGNDIDGEGLDHIIHYIRSGVCQGLDLGGNSLRDHIGRLAGAFSDTCPLWALCLADCDLTNDSVKPLWPALVTLPNFRFLDLSHNRELLASPTCLGLLRKYLPQLKWLKRLHLADVAMTPAQAIALAEVLPECPHLCHVSLLENQPIMALSTATDEASQEEAVALYASFMAAAKVSHTLICIDVDVPSSEQSELVKALAKQVVAYCLRNMENFTEIPELNSPPKEIEVPGVLQNLVGTGEDSGESHDSTEPPPDENYIVGGTGVVKALSYCLLQKASDLRRSSLPASGAHTPQASVEAESSSKAKNVSANLLETARNIKTRLQGAIVREEQAGNDLGYRRLLFLDQTLQGIIQRFEDEYPDTRLQPQPANANADADSLLSTSQLSTSTPPSTNNTLSTSLTLPEHPDSDDDEPHLLRSRHNSDVSLASRALSLEEGRIHRLGQRVRTEILNAHSKDKDLSSAIIDDDDDDQRVPSATAAGSSSTNGPVISSTFTSTNPPPTIKLESLSGEELRSLSEGLSPDDAVRRITDNAHELGMLLKENPADFEKFRVSQLAALRNRTPGFSADESEKVSKADQGKSDVANKES